MDKIFETLKKKDLEGFEVYFEETESNPIIFEQNELQSLEKKFDRGVGVRVIHRGRLGFSSTNDLERPDEVVEYALESAKYGEKVNYTFPGPSETERLQIYSDEGWPESERIEIGKRILEELKGLAKDVKIDMELNHSRKKVLILNSAGLRAKMEKTFYSFEISGFTITESGFVWVYEQKASLKPLPPFDDLIGKLLEKLEHANRTARSKSGELKVVFAPQALFSLIRPFAVGLNGKNIAKKISPLTDRVGEKIIGENITFIDDGTKPWSWGTRPFDDEGIPVRKRFLIEKGVLRGYLLDLNTSSKVGMQSTGNAFRKYTSLPSPSFNNLIIEPGEVPSSEILKDLDYGIVVHSVIGGGQSNLLAGDFSLNIGLGFLVENGEIVGRVKDTMVAGNVYDCFNRVYAISKDTEALGPYILPYIAFEKLSVTSKE